MRLYISILISFLVITANYGQKLDTVFNGYLSPIVQTGGASPNFTFTGAFHNDLGTFDGTEVTTDAVLIMESDGNCYELPIVSLSATGTIISGTLNDPSAELAVIPSGTAAVVRRTDNKSLYPIPAGLPQSTEGCIHTINMLIIDTLSVGGAIPDGIDSSFIRNDSVFLVVGVNEYFTGVATNSGSGSTIDSTYVRNDSTFLSEGGIEYFIGIAVSGSGGSFSVLDTTITAVSYTVDLSSVQEVRVVADVTSNNIAVTLPAPDTTTLGKRIKVEQINASANYATINVDAIGNRILLPGADFPVANIVNPNGFGKIGHTFETAYDDNSAIYVWSSVSETTYSESDGLKFYDQKTSAKQKVKVDYEVDSITQILQLNVNNGDNIYVKPTGARYVVQASAVTGYTTDTIAVVPVDGKYAVLQFNPINYFEYFGVVAGSDKTDEVRRANWVGFKKALKYAEKSGKRATLSPYSADVYEFYIDNGSVYKAEAKVDIIIDLNGADFVFYPVVQSYAEEILDLDPYEVHFELRNGTIRGFRPSFETYEATLKPSGNADTIILTASDIRTDFATDVIGSQIYASYDYDRTADTVIVTAYDVVNKILTLNRDITVGGTDDAGWIGIRWQTENLDTIERYKAYWLDWDFSTGEEVGLVFIRHLNNGPSEINFKFQNLKVNGFYNFISSSNNTGVIEFDNCDLSGHSGIASMFNDQGLYKLMRINNCYVHDTGFESKGQIPGHPQVDGDRYNGGTFYTHPNTKADVRNTVFDNCVASYRQYSSSGTKPINYQVGYSIFENCEWINNEFDLYNLYTSSSNQTSSLINNCTFNGGELWATGKSVKVTNTDFINCDFKSNNITFENCRFDTLSSCILGAENNASMKFFNCFIDLPSTTPAYWMPWAPDTLILDNVVAKTVDRSVNGAFAGFIGQGGLDLKYLSVSNSYFDLNTDDEFIQRMNSFSTRSIYVTNTTLSQGAIFGPIGLSNGYKSVKFNNYKGYIHYTKTDLPFNNAIYPEVVTPVTTSYTGTIPSAATFRLYNTYNNYRLNGSAKRIIFNDNITTYIRGHGTRGGLIRFTASGGTVTIPKYNPATVDSVSNFTFDVNLADGETLTCYFDNFMLKYDAAVPVTNDTLGTLTTATIQTFYNTFGKKVIPNTVTLNVGGVTVTDDGDGILSGTGITGTIDYYFDAILLEFTGTVPVGKVIAAYSYPNALHHVGMFLPLSTEKEGSGELAVYSNTPADTIDLTTSYVPFTGWQLSDVYGAVSTSVGGDSLLLKKGTYEIHYDAQWVSFDGQADTAYIVTGIREGAGVVTKSLRKCYKGSNLSGRTNLVSVTYRTEIASDGTPVSFVVSGDDGSSGGHKVLFEKLIFYINRIE